MVRVRVVLTLALAGVAAGGCQTRESVSADTNRPATAAAPAKPAKPASPAKPAKPAEPARPATPSKPAQPQSPAGSVAPAPVLATGDGDVDRVAQWLCGDFENAAQAEADAGYTHLQRHGVRIWPQRTDATWIYSEVSAGVSADIIVSQQVLKVTRRTDGAVVLALHVFKSDSAAHAGAWRKGDALAGVDPASLEHRTGCDVMLWKASDKLYDGSTEGKGCTPSNQGFVVIEMEIGPDRIVNWERTLDPGYRLVQGPLRGGHAFVRTTPAKP